MSKYLYAAGINEFPSQDVRGIARFRIEKIHCKRNVSKQYVEKCIIKCVHKIFYIIEHKLIVPRVFQPVE